MSPFQLIAVILLEGFVTVSAQILTIRQLMPMTGNSVIVTSLIVGIFLLFLAIGYKRGGSYQKNYQAVLRRNFALSSVWLGIGLSYGFIELLFEMLSKQGCPRLLILNIYLFCITAPLVYILGQTVPITMNLFKDKQDIGKIGGNVLYISTIGSFLGSIVTALVFMNYMGLAWSVFANVLVLIFLYVIVSSKITKHEPVRFGVLILFVGCSYFVNLKIEKDRFLLTNNYANYSVKNFPFKNTKLLIANKSVMSRIDDRKKGAAYIERIKKILFDDLKLTNKKILVLGAGGFSLSAETENENEFIYVDIDDGLHAFVEKHFLKEIKGQTVSQDARAFLRETKQKFDVVVVDVYSNMYTIPEHLVTQDYFLQIRKVLPNKGMAIFNIISSPFLKDPYSKRMDNTIHSVFDRCMATTSKYTEKHVNLLYVCHKDIKKTDETVYRNR
jgi:predicted membrane-bound spermidine synthase